MRTYGQIRTTYWRDPEIAALGDMPRTFGAYLLTGPHSNGIGCYFLPPEYVTADLGWGSKTVSEAFTQLASIGFVRVCPTTKFILIPKFLKFNEIANPNVAKSRVKEFEQIPKKVTFYHELAECLKAFGNHWPKEFEKVLATVSKQEPNQTYPFQTDPNRVEAPPEAPPPAAPPAAKQPDKKGTRFKPHDGGLPDAWRAIAADMRPDVDAQDAYGSFCDYWSAKPGKEGLKLDWDATWRNWLRKEKPSARRPQGGNGAIASTHVPDDWWKSDAGVRAKALEVEVTPPAGAASPSEWLLFKAKVIVAAGEGPWVPDEREITLYRAVEWVRKQQSQ